MCSESFSSVLNVIVYHFQLCLTYTCSFIHVLFKETKFSSCKLFYWEMLDPVCFSLNYFCDNVLISFTYIQPMGIWHFINISIGEKKKEMGILGNTFINYYHYLSNMCMKLHVYVKLFYWEMLDPVCFSLDYFCDNVLISFTYIQPMGIWHFINI